MRYKRSLSVLVLVFVLSTGRLFAQQSSPAKPTGVSPKLCVAAVGNGSLKPIFVNEIQDELVKQLLAAGLNTEEASTATLVAKKLELSGNNQDSMRLRKCDFMLLTAVDSAKPAAGESGTSPGSELLLSFALFRKKAAKPLVDSSIEAPQADTPTHAIEKAVDKEVEQVRQSLARK